MHTILGAACGFVLAMGSAAIAQPVVIELYTSQGCSACPPADEEMARLADDPRVIALALHVDYWDYIGWKDAFGQAAFTDRQKAYARMTGDRTLYTPQFIVNGRDRIQGTQPRDLESMILHHAATPAAVTLTADRVGDQMHIRAEAVGALRGPLKVTVVRYRPEIRMEIDKGENAGMSIDYHNIVTSWNVVQDWAGTAPLDATLPVTGEEPAVVILQEAGPGAILSAARLD
ncbi:DUF1223 domain-containing protein [Falsirhodobacter halotolerans]|uniref:DUF1223 domain-containing protein n=1 Tax=Falsirhodobacter halotolerans TaxID=1146892 RepID=UPI001FD612D1|nr:DUF1223 domain-containing protein [Falsirhodobacter halotolerans]MCJ8139807.1 DUF1223 domain-containing protein [Falsirhodobacter halotolerans]